MIHALKPLWIFLKRDITILFQNYKLVWIPFFSMLLSLGLLGYLVPDIIQNYGNEIFLFFLFLAIANQESGFSEDEESGYFEVLRLTSSLRPFYFSSKLLSLVLFWITAALPVAALILKQMDLIVCLRLFLFITGTTAVLLILSLLIPRSSLFSGLMILFGLPLFLPLLILANSSLITPTTEVTIAFGFYTSLCGAIYGLIALKTGSIDH